MWERLHVFVSWAHLRARCLRFDCGADVTGAGHADARMPDDAPVAAPILDQRTLNRTLLARQGLLHRERRPVAGVLEDLVGLQAQEPQNPFVALWSRIEGFDPAALDRLLLERAAVRTGLMRTTLHLVTVDDALSLQPLFAPVLARTLQSQRAFRIALEGLDPAEVAAEGERHLSEQPMTAGALRPLLAERFPGRDPAVLMMAVRYLVPIVQVPPRGLWRQSRQPTLTTLSAWTGRPPATDGDVDALVLRYLRAFGPASTSDLRTWCWLTGLAPVVARLRGALRTYRDASGRELLDVPDGPIVDGGEAAPIRFLPEYDNSFLSNADRARITPTRPTLEQYDKGTLLVDGFATAGWRLKIDAGATDLVIRPIRRLTVAERLAVEDEAQSFLAFLAQDADHARIAWAMDLAG